MVRDENGRFVKGNSGGPGRPPKKREQRYLEIAKGTITYKQFRALIEDTYKRAMRGDSQARKILFDYLLGSPTQRHEHSGPDNEPMKIQMIEVIKDYGNEE